MLPLLPHSQHSMHEHIIIICYLHRIQLLLNLINSFCNELGSHVNLYFDQAHVTPSRNRFIPCHKTVPIGNQRNV